MSTTTACYDLIKPDLTDIADITLLNHNWDKIDEELGLLHNAQNFAIKDIDNIKLPGHYCTPESITSEYGNFPEELYYLNFYMHVDAFFNGTRTTQTIYVQGGTTTHKLSRCTKGNEWEPWEWENPPMVPGVEYRTTERSNGDAVYVKRISYQFADTVGSESGVALINIPHDINGFSKLVRVFGRNETSNYPLPYIGSSGGITVINAVNDKNVQLRTKEMTWGNNHTWSFDVYYTK